MTRRKPKPDTLLAAPARPTPPETAAKALERIIDRLRAIPGDTLRRITTNIPRSVSIALGAAPRIAELREEIIVHLPKFDLAQVDDLPTIAMGSWYAHLQWVASSDQSDGSEFEATLARAVDLRRVLLGDADALARRGLVDVGRVAEIREGRGHLDTANDLVALSALFEEAWPRVSGRTAATAEEVEEAAVQGTTLLVALSRRGEPGATIAPATDAADMRTRAFTALYKSYDQCRRAVGYLRWDERDANALAPSLFANRSAPKRREPAEAVIDETDDERVGPDDAA